MHAHSQSEHTFVAARLSERSCAAAGERRLLPEGGLGRCTRLEQASKLCAVCFMTASAPTC